MKAHIHGEFQIRVLPANLLLPHALYIHDDDNLAVYFNKFILKKCLGDDLILYCRAIAAADIILALTPSDNGASLTIETPSPSFRGS